MPEHPEVAVRFKSKQQASAAASESEPVETETPPATPAAEREPDPSLVIVGGDEPSANFLPELTPEDDAEVISLGERLQPWNDIDMLVAAPEPTRREPVLLVLAGGSVVSGALWLGETVRLTDSMNNGRRLFLPVSLDDSGDEESPRPLFVRRSSVWLVMATSSRSYTGSTTARLVRESVAIVAGGAGFEVEANAHPAVVGNVATWLETARGFLPLTDVRATVRRPGHDAQTFKHGFGLLHVGHMDYFKLQESV